MADLRTLLPAGIAVLGLGVAVLVSQPSGPEQPGPAPTPSPSALPGLPAFGSFTPQAGCIEDLPPEIPEPPYRPRSLSLPEGSVPIRLSPDPAPGLHLVTYRVPVDLDAFADHVLKEWPERGWVLGRGEREPAEAESVFYLPDKSRYGHLRARSVYCDRDQTEVTLTLGEDTGANSTPSGGP